MSRKRLPRWVKYVVRGLPVAGAAGSAFLPLHLVGQQFMILIVLIWVQVFFVLEVIMAGK